MLKQFVQTEFNYASKNSWLEQFEHAVSLIDSNPQQALQILLDTDLERWYLICKQINDIEEVAEAIEFLSQSFDYPDNDVSSCRSVLCFKSKLPTFQTHEQIDLVIQVAKLASFPRRYDEATAKINARQDLVEQLSITEKIIEELIQNLNNNIKDANEIKKNGWNLTSMVNQITEMYKKQREMRDREKDLQTEIKVLTRVRKTLGPVPCLNM
jgi:DNA repair exonuclease SbcCD ATPase subunit